MPEIAIESVNFRKVWEMVSGGQYQELADYLSEKVRNLANGGAEVISLTAVTMHLVFDELVRNTGVSLVSIPQAVSKEAIKRGYKKVGLLGTMATMENDFMKKDMQRAGIEVFVPDKEDRALIAQRILEELELGIVKESTRQEFNAIIKTMQQNHGIEAVVLGCTEIPLLLDDENCVLPCLDSVAIHIERLKELVLDDVL